MIWRTLFFLLLNFSALGIGSIFTSTGINTDWYIELNQAPWTPPGWMFGFAWTLIMMSFSFYMAYAWPVKEYRPLLSILYILQWILNVSWNPVFFYFQFTGIAFLIIISLLLVICLIGFFFREKMRNKTILILPYFFWLLIASSLNAYILIMN